MKWCHPALLSILPTLISAVAPSANCTSDDQCSPMIRSSYPGQGSATDVAMCDCYAVSSIDPFDECEGDEVSCMVARCAEDKCAGLTAFCTFSENGTSETTCALKLDDGVIAGSSTGGGDDCSALTTCNECLANEGCAHWSMGECMSDCMISDVPCYAPQFFTGMTTDEICTQADNDSKDSKLCGSMSDCTSCLEAVKSDGASTCMWFEDIGFCDKGCSMMGCGSTDIAACSSEASSSSLPTLTTTPATDGITTSSTVPVPEQLDEGGVAPNASCTSDNDCSAVIRSRYPAQSGTNVLMCGCYAASSIDPFDECEGNESSCATARCSEDACAGLTAYCSESETCTLKSDAAATTTPATQATNEGPVDNETATTSSTGSSKGAPSSGSIRSLFASCMAILMASLLLYVL